MTSMDTIRGFLGLKRFAFVGLSRDATDFSRSLFREFQAKGYDPVPVNPDAPALEGQRCFARLADVEPPVEGALFMTPAAVTETLVHDCPSAGIKRVWMFRGAGQGSATPETIRFCEAQGISVVPGECPFMFLPGEPWVHRLHGAFRKLTGRFPH
ncbi:MAG TPA: CoA-binding protein [Bryobacteraceae bacterium]|nr:CoA-binding protein [Bryobacteraceae bacterium]